MNLVGRPVLIKAGNNLNKVGMVKSFEFGLYVVEIGDKTFGFDPEDLEPLFNLKEVAAVHVTETDDDGDPIGTTQLEKMVKPFGLSTEELAEYIGDFVVDAAARVRGVGREQYDMQGYQKFESYSIPELFEQTDEEVLDLMNYLVMIRIMLIRLFNAVMAPDDLVEDENEDSDAGH